jgi:AraC-like DNA-binding protein
MALRFEQILILFTVFQLLVFAIVLIMKKTTREANQLFLALFFFALACNIFNLFVFMENNFFISNKGIHLFYLGSPFAFLYAPAFYLYLLTYTTFSPRMNAGKVLHFIPFVLYMGYILISFSFLSVDEKRKILLHGGLLSPAFYQFLIISLQLQVLLYVSLSVSQILKFRNRLKNQYSSDEKINFSWISSLLVAILCLWLMDIVRFFANYFSYNIKVIVDTCLFIGFILFCYFFLFKSMSHRYLPLEKDIQSDSKKLSLSELTRKKYEHQLIQYMNINKPYLDAEITLMDLAKKVDIPARSLSEVVNISFGQNFYDFINSYRIREATLLFESNDDQNKTILEVLFEVGFNSKSSFNSAFKRITGMTPTEYRRNQNLIDQEQKIAG